MQTFDFTNYSKLAGRTCKQFNSPEKHFLHMALGLSTELFELMTSKDMGNTKEECGDIFWYLGSSFDYLDPEGIADIATIKFNEQDHLSLLQNAETFISYMKKVFVYDKEFVYEDAYRMLVFVLQSMLSHCVFNKQDINLILKQNIDKLQKRYPEAYSNERATVRLDKI